MQCLGMCPAEVFHTAVVFRFVSKVTSLNAGGNCFFAFSKMNRSEQMEHYNAKLMSNLSLLMELLCLQTGVSSVVNS